MESFLMAQGIPVRVFDSKKGDNTILLLHGYLETLSVWDDFADGLIKNGYRIVSLDLPGHGLSGTKGEIHTMEFISDVIYEILNKLGIQQCFVTGHSMGGYIALAFAKKYNEKTSGVCLFHSTPNADTDEKKLNRDREIELIKANKLELIIRNNIPRIFANDNVKLFSEKIEEIEVNAEIADSDGIVACLRGMKEREDMNPFLKLYTKPLLFVFGVKDNYIPFEVAQNIINNYPNATSIILENSGHAGFIEEEQMSVEKFVEFCDKVFN